ncbi:MAG: Sapep family Mn(2+)-dependent dipeptidase [Anaerolineaceae bacterium]|nr:Sapep family Mn(2+)-dependent dipeptidase [Anaerolineaceae bacterium]
MERQNLAIRQSDPIEAWLHERKEKILGDLADLVSCKSVSVHEQGENPFGSECSAALKKALEISALHRMQTTNLENFCGFAQAFGQPGAEEIGLFTHLDVVPAARGWLNDPFTLTIKDGWALGRGVCDNKGGALASIYALDYLRTHSTLQKNWLIFFGLNEEKAMKDIQYFLKKRSAPALSLIPDTEFPVCYAEKSHVCIEIHLDLSQTNLLHFSAGNAVNIVPRHAEAALLPKEKRLCDAQPGDEKSALKVRAEGRSTHASLPEKGKNAIVVLCRKLLAQDLLNEEGRRQMELAASLAGDIHGKKTGIAHDGGEFGHTTQVCSIARLNHGRLELKFDIRFPCLVAGDDIIKSLKKTYADLGLPLRVIEVDEALPKNSKHPLIKELTRIANEEMGAQLEPYTMGGLTYARKLPNAYGFGLERVGSLPDFLDDGHGGVHQPDECIHIDEYLHGIKILIRALQWIDDFPSPA